MNKEIDCQDTCNKRLNAEIMDLKDSKYLVHFTGFNNKYDEWIPIDSERILQ